MAEQHLSIRRVNRALGVVIIAGLLLHFHMARPAGMLGVLLITAPVALVGIVRRSWRETAVWVAYLAGVAAFMGLRSVADDVGFPVQIDYVILLDRVLFLGAVPTVWLQNRFYAADVIGAFDWMTIWTHVSYFFVPQVLAFFLLVYRPQQFGPYLATIIITFYAALPIHVLLPTAPPWLAAEAGTLEPVTRVVQAALTDTFDRGAALVGDNEVAAFPSLHTAATVIVALGMAQFGRVAAGIGWAYVALMVLALTYLGEHYVVDAIAGALLAVAAWRLVRRVASRTMANDPAPAEPLIHA